MKFDFLCEQVNPGITLSFVGDVMLGRKVINSSDLFLNQDIFKSSDLNICNLECPITNNSDDIADKLTALRAEYLPENFPFNAVTLANNHSLDYKWQGLNDTIRVLNDRGIMWAGLNIKPWCMCPVKNKKVAILAYCSDEYDTAFPIGRYDKFNIRPAVYNPILFAEHMDEIKVAGADVIIVSIHWGYEYDTEPDEKQISLGRYLVDRGVNIVMGHHPHVQQEIEMYNEGLIAYSLGNFIFDQDRYDKPGTEKGKILTVNIADEITYKEIDTISNELTYVPEIV